MSTSTNRAQAANGPRLDPRTPLVLDTRELPRRAGSMRRLQRTVSAPERLGLELLHVPERSDVVLDLRLEAVVEGVLVSGTAAMQLTGECGRCLDPVSDSLVVDLQQLYAYGDSEVPEDEETGRLSGDLLDLEPALRDAVVLALPLTPLCDADCGGLCADCGERLDDLPEDHGHSTADPRWAALAALQSASETDPDSEESPRGRP
ncbi:MAG: YceD family protein [Actinomycetota bacterium]|jgi:uncharacterized protein|nr:YceD family protein [Actinomycetota bacterium]